MKQYARTFFHNLQQIFTPHQQQTFKALMVLFLHATGKPLPHYTKLKSESAISRFFNHYHWDTRKLIRLSRQQVTEVIQTYRGRKGRKHHLELIVDLTTLEKRGKFKGLGGWLHVLKHARGLHLIVLCVKIGPHCFPWSFRIWNGKGSKSPTVHALRMIQTFPETLSKGFKVRVLADGGFDAAMFIVGVHQLGYSCIVGTRSTRKTTEGKKLSQYPFRTRTIYLKDVQQNKNPIPIYFSWVWLERSGRWEKRYVLSTEKMTPNNIRLIGRKRWAIEGVFKVLKHRFGLHRFGQKSKLGVLRYLLLSLVAYVLSHLQLEVKRKGFADWGKLSRQAALLFLKLELDQELLRLKAVLDWEYALLCKALYDCKK